MKFILLALIILFALDIVFRDGELILFFLSQEMYLPFFIKVIFVCVAVVASFLLLHAIISDFNLLPKITRKKTEYEIEKEIEAERNKALQENLKKEEETE